MYVMFAFCFVLVLCRVGSLCLFVRLLSSRVSLYLVTVLVASVLQSLHTCADLSVGLFPFVFSFNISCSDLCVCCVVWSLIGICHIIPSCSLWFVGLVQFVRVG